MDVFWDQVFNFFTVGSTFSIVMKIYTLGGWVILLSMLFFAGFYMLYTYKRKLWKKDWNWILLAIDIPQENVQTPKAVEQLFAHIFSVMDPPSIGTKYWRGFYQYQFSLEIISIEGYIQFLIRTVDKYRDVVEAAVYAQYPDAEITEVEDYTKNIPDKYPNDTHKIWAADFCLTQNYAYPIRMYHEFEHNISKDTVLKDPMGTFLESFSRIGEGEQLWYQIIIEPLEEFRWKNNCIKEIKKVIGEKQESKSNFLDKLIFDNPISKEIGKGFQEINAQISGVPAGEDSGYSKSDDNSPPNQILYLTPGQKVVLEAMESKISKIGYKTKMRGVYVARKEVYNPARAVNSLVGAVNQFNNPSSNSILPKYITSTEYFFSEYRDNLRRNAMMSAYKKRNPWVGKSRYVLNIEELATLWHFPMSHVATPRVQKATIKSAEPPPGLPIEMIDSSIAQSVVSVVEEKKRLIKTDTGEEIEFDDFG